MTEKEMTRTLNSPSDCLAVLAFFARELFQGHQLQPRWLTWSGLRGLPHVRNAIVAGNPPGTFPDKVTDVTWRAWTTFAALCVIWGVPYFFIKLALQDLSPPVVAWTRFALATAVLVPIAW